MSDIDLLSGIALILSLAFLLGVFVVHSGYFLFRFFISKKPIAGNLIYNTIGLSVAILPFFFLPEKKFKDWLVFILPVLIYGVSVFLIKVSREAEPASLVRKESQLTQSKKSPMYFQVVLILAVFYFIFFEVVSRIETGETFLAHFGNSFDGKIGFIAVWLITTFVWLLLAGNHIRTMYISCYGQPSAYVFLGDKGTRGQFVYKENDEKKTELFVSSLLSGDPYPKSSFSSIYERRYFAKDWDGNLTDSREFGAGQIIIMSIVQLGLLIFSMAATFGIVSEGKIKSMDSSPMLISTVAIFFFFFNVGGSIINWMKMKGFDHGGERVARLPKSISTGAIITGKIIDTEPYHVSSDKKSRTYIRYTVKFNQTEFDPPVYINWEERKYFDRELTDYNKSLRKEKKEAQRLNQKAFDLMDNAFKTKAYVQFKIDQDLCIRPVLDEPYEKED